MRRTVGVDRACVANGRRRGDEQFRWKHPWGCTLVLFTRRVYIWIKERIIFELTEILRGRPKYNAETFGRSRRV